MINLSQSDLALVKSLTDRAYQHLHPDVRAYLNEQLLEASLYWEVREWLERMETVAKWYEKPMITPVSRSSRRAVSSARKQLGPTP